MRQREYRAPIYWFAVMMVAIFGTMAADGIHDGASIPYAATTPLFALITAAVFWRWYRSEGTLSIHSITTRRREGFYWAAVLATFALGTAAGDLTATSLKLGFFGSAVLFAGISKPHAITGLGLGDGAVSGLALIIFVALVAYVAVTKVDVQDARHSEHPHLYLQPHPELVPEAD